MSANTFDAISPARECEVSLVVMIDVKARRVPRTPLEHIQAEFIDKTAWTVRYIGVRTDRVVTSRRYSRHPCRFRVVPSRKHWRRSARPFPPHRHFCSWSCKRAMTRA